MRRQIYRQVQQHDNDNVDEREEGIIRLNDNRNGRK